MPDGLATHCKHYWDPGPSILAPPLQLPVGVTVFNNTASNHAKSLLSLSIRSTKLDPTSLQPQTLYIQPTQHLSSTITTEITQKINNKKIKTQNQPSNSNFQDPSTFTFGCQRAATDQSCLSLSTSLFFLRHEVTGTKN